VFLLLLSKKRYLELWKKRLGGEKIGGGIRHLGNKTNWTCLHTYHGVKAGGLTEEGDSLAGDGQELRPSG